MSNCADKEKSLLPFSLNNDDRDQKQEVNAVEGGDTKRNLNACTTPETDKG